MTLEGRSYNRSRFKGLRRRKPHWDNCCGEWKTEFTKESDKKKITMQDFENIKDENTHIYTFS